MKFSLICLRECAWYDLSLAVAHGASSPIHVGLLYCATEFASITSCCQHYRQLEMWANAQRHGPPAEYRWRPLFNAAKIG